MDRAIRRMWMSAACVFVLLMGTLSYIQFFDSKTLMNNQWNSRALYDNYGSARGSIVVDGTEIASSVKEGELLPGVLYGDTDIVDIEGKFLRKRHLQTPQTLTSNSFKHGMLVCHQAFYARLDIAKKIPFNTHFRYSADIDWCIKIMREGEKEGLLLRNVHAVIANYLEEGQTTKHHRASLYERFRVMCKHYGVFPTIAKHAWFVVRLFTKK